MNRTRFWYRVASRTSCKFGNECINVRTHLLSFVLQNAKYTVAAIKSISVSFTSAFSLVDVVTLKQTFWGFERTKSFVTRDVSHEGDA